MSYSVSKIGHLDPRFYSLIYCAIPGVQMSGVQMSDFISKIGHLDPRFYSVIYCAIPGVQISGVQMSGVQMSGVQMSGVQMYPTRRLYTKRQFFTKTQTLGLGLPLLMFFPFKILQENIMHNYIAIGYVNYNRNI